MLGQSVRVIMRKAGSTFYFAWYPTHLRVDNSVRTSYCVAVTLVGALTVVLLLANEVSVLMQPQRTEQVTA